MIPLKSPQDLKRMRQSGRLAAEVLLRLEDLIRPGMTTGELDRVAYDTIVKAKAKPAFLGYHGFPGTICASVNEEVVHGIPSDGRELVEGDIISVDVGVVYKGFYGDNARTYAVGAISPECLELMKVTHESLVVGVGQLRAGSPLGAASDAIQRHVESHGFSVVRQFVGHGIGKALHEEPQVPNFGRPTEGPMLKPGMVLAVEPMVNAGTHEVETLEDGWGVVTRDGKPSAHFEYTVAILSDGVEVLTEWDTSAA